MDFGIETKLTCTLETNVEYLVVYSQSDITAGFENLDEGDGLKIKFKRVL